MGAVSNAFVLLSFFHRPKQVKKFYVRNVLDTESCIHYFVAGEIRDGYRPNEEITAREKL